MICIRKAKLSDLERLMQMETMLYNFHATKDDRFKRIEITSKSAVEDEIKNLDLYFVISDEHYVFGFMKCIEKEINNEVRAITLETQTANGIAIEFYKKNGYNIEGIDISLYSNEDIKKEEIALIMKKRFV